MKHQRVRLFIMDKRREKIIEKLRRVQLNGSYYDKCTDAVNDLTEKDKQITEDSVIKVE